MRILRVAVFACALALMSGLAFGAKININTAGAQVLQKLENIGPVRAQAIIDYRQRKGDFETLAELTKVQGIGEETLDANRDRITLE